MTRLHTALAALLLTPWALPGVIVIDPAGGNGAAQLQAALDGAADGDVILLRAGDYVPRDGAPLLVDGVGVTLAPDIGAGSLVTGGLVVRALPETSRLVLRGLELVAAAGTSALDLDASVQGHVWVEECTLVGGDGIADPGDFNLATGEPAWVATQCGAITCIRSELLAGHGADADQPGTIPGHGGLAVVLQFQPTRAVFQDCLIVGGDGGAGQSFFGSSGGLGLVGLDMTLATLGGDVRGGNAGGTPPPFSLGGNGLSYGLSTTPMLSRRTRYQGGLGTTPDQDGVGFDATTESLMQFASAPRRGVRAEPVGLASTTTVLEFSGAQGDVAALLVGLDTTFKLMPARQGVLLGAALVGGPVVVGALPAGGQLDASFELPTLPVGTAAAALVLQGVTLGPGPVTVDGASLLTIVDSGS